MLKLYPRSGLGFKYKLHLNNTVEIIDSDYNDSDNEGHIFVKLVNDSGDKIPIVGSGGSVVQGIFIPYGITVDDDAKGM